MLPHLPPTTVLAASKQILCDNTCAQKPSQSLLKNKSKTKQKNGIIYIYTCYLARTQKIEEIVTLNTSMKPLFNWGRLASEIVMAARGVIVTWLPGVTTVLGHGLTHWGRVTHKYVSKLNIIGSDNGLSPGWRQAIIFTNAGILLIQNAGTNFREILSEIHTFSLRENAFENIVYEIAAIFSRPRCVKDRYFLNLQECQKYLNFHVWKIAKIYLISKSHEK